MSGKKRDKDHAELRGQVYLAEAAATRAVFDKRYSVPEARLRDESHRLADLLDRRAHRAERQLRQPPGLRLRATGGRAARLHHRRRRARRQGRVAAPDQSAIAPAFGKDGEPLLRRRPRRTASTRSTTATGALVPHPVQGLGLRHRLLARPRRRSPSRSASATASKVFAGPGLRAACARPPQVGMALHPAFTPAGKLAFSGEGQVGQRIYVDGKPITPDGLFASSPVFCNNPDGVRADLRGRRRQGQRSRRRPARTAAASRASPRARGATATRRAAPTAASSPSSPRARRARGPGLYLMRLDGERPKRVSTLLGDSLRWDALPPGEAVEWRSRARAAAP